MNFKGYNMTAIGAITVSTACKLPEPDSSDSGVLKLAIGLGVGLGGGFILITVVILVVHSAIKKRHTEVEMASKKLNKVAPAKTQDDEIADGRNTAMGGFKGTDGTMMTSTSMLKDDLSIMDDLKKANGPPSTETGSVVPAN
jgi:hypothetical protein